MALPIFAITLFVSAFLLFLIQPMIGKMILPNLGGTPQVWNTCMVFFQTALLAGYGYTHTVSTRLKLRTQLFLHCGVLLLPLVLIIGCIMWASGNSPEGADGGTFRGLTKYWIPPAGGNPIVATLFLLTWVVGLPFFVVSTSAPLLQKWFAYTGHPSAKDPYFLYGASNLGSMLSLVFFPFLIEPMETLYEQSWTWIIGYGLMVVLFAVCVGFVWKAPPAVELPGQDEKTEKKPERKEEKLKEEPAEKETGIAAGAPKKKSSMSSKIRKGSKQRKKKVGPQPVVPARSVSRAAPRVAYEEVRSDVMTPWRRIRWVLLAFVPSSLMLGITTYISTDVSAIPLFWVIPLALYLLSFILVFAKWPVVWTRQAHTLMVMGQPIAVLFFIYLLITGSISPIYRSIAFSILAFFLTAMVCHGELARNRPSTKHLTEFYLWMSVGGMLGGVFNALVAPVIFWGLAELPIALVIAFLMRPQVDRLAPVDRPLMIIASGLFGLVFGGVLLWTWQPLLGPLVGAGLGIVIGAAFNLDYRMNGWTEIGLLSLFPGLGDWADEKGKELRQEVGKEGESEETPKRRLSRTAVAPDYYVLNYACDLILPALVILYMMAAVAFTPSPNDSRELQGSFLFSFANKTLGYEPSQSVQIARNLVYALRFGVPLVIFGLLFSFRPIRVGLAIGAIFLITSVWSEQSESREVLYRTRTYFGILRVLQSEQSLLTSSEVEQLERNNDPDAKIEISKSKLTPYTYLMHGTTHHGLNFQSPKGLRRLATTYYHRKGPVGVIMERFNWFPGPQNTYWADVRMPAALVGLGAGPLNFAMMPETQLVNLWSEPAYCCIGLGTGTMSSYARPFQHMTFYEIDEQIRQFSLGKFKLPATLFAGDAKIPSDLQGPYFNYIHDSIARGANVEIYMGDARISMKENTERSLEKERENGGFPNWKENRSGIAYQFRKNYYHAMEIDAFSSDAIPVHLITREAIEQYLDKLAPEGVILVHTSNRHVDLVAPVTDIAREMGLEYRVVNCLGQGERRQADGKLIGSGDRGHFQSEYVMLGRNFKQIAKLTGRTEEEAQSDAKKRWNDRVKQLLGVDDAALKNREALIEAGKKKQLTAKADERISDELIEELVKVWYRDSVLPDPTHDWRVAEKEYILQRYRGEQEIIGYQIWTVPPPPGNRIWTDDYSNMMSVFRWGFGH